MKKNSQMFDDGVKYVVVEDPKKNRGSGILAILLLLVLVGAGFLGYRGYAALRDGGLFSSSDLGVKTSQDAYESFESKLGLVIAEPPVDTSGYKQVWGETQEKNVSLTSEEVSSFLENLPAVSDIAEKTQVSFSDNGNMRFVSKLNTSSLLTKLAGMGFDQAALKAFPLPGTIPVKIDMDVFILNNAVKKLTLNSVSVMGLDVAGLVEKFGGSLNLGDNAQGDLNGMIEGALAELINTELKKANANSGLYIFSSSASDGALKLVGQIPSSVGWEASAGE